MRAVQRAVGHGHGMDNNTLQVGLLLASVCNVA